MAQQRNPLHYRALITSELRPGQRVVRCMVRLGAVTEYTVADTPELFNGTNTVFLQLDDGSMLRHICWMLGLEPDENGIWDSQSFLLDKEFEYLADEVDDHVEAELEDCNEQ